MEEITWEIFGYDGFDLPPEVQSMVTGIFLTALGVTLAVAAVMYIMVSVGLYAMAQRRGLSKPWLAWLPVGNAWILGGLSDQYQYAVWKRPQNRRTVMLITSAVTVVAGLLTVDWMVKLIRWAIEEAQGNYVSPDWVIRPSILGAAATVVAAIGGIILAVYTFLCLYNVYRSCTPQNATVFLVLSIFFPVTIPFFLCLNRRKDGGMRPGAPAWPGGPYQGQPWQSQQPWQNQPWQGQQSWQNQPWQGQQSWQNQQQQNQPWQSQQPWQNQPWQNQQPRQNQQQQNQPWQNRQPWQNPQPSWQPQQNPQQPGQNQPQSPPAPRQDDASGEDKP